MNNHNELVWDMRGGFAGMIIIPFIMFILKWTLISYIFWSMYVEVVK